MIQRATAQADADKGEEYKYTKLLLKTCFVGEHANHDNDVVMLGPSVR